MIYRFGEFELDTQNFKLQRNNIEVEAEPKVFDLLNFLIANRERLVTRDELFVNLWPGQVVSDASLSNQIKSARLLIGDNGRTQKSIKTFHGRGYQFIAPISETETVRPSAGLFEELKSDKPSIAVLSFSNLSGEPEKDYISDGITDDIITALCHFRDLVVIHRGSSLKFKHQSVDVETVAAHLGARYLVEGSVRIANKRMRVSVQLTDATVGNHLWAESYDSELMDMFDSLDEITQKIVTMVARCLEQSGWETALKKEKESLTVYELLLRARHYYIDWNGTQEEVLQARNLYGQASKLDPNCAPAFSGLAVTYCAEYLSTWTDDRDFAGRQAFKFAKQALTLDNRDSNAHLVLATAHRDITGDYELAFLHIDKAIEANPNDYWLYCCKSYMLTQTGEFREGISYSRLAIRRSPLLPDSCLEGNGYAEYFSEHYKRALVSFSEILAPKSKHYAYIAACYAQLGHHDKASIAAEEFRIRNSENPVIKEPADAESWCQYWLSYCHFKDSKMHNHLLEGLRKSRIV